MKKLLLVTLLVFNIQFINAQYTDIINSKRPGLSESPYGVGTDVLQFEGGFFYGQSDSDATWAIVDPMGATAFLRYGKFIEKLEINANITYQKSDLQFKNILSSSRPLSGVSQLTVGAKYLIFQQEFEDKSKEIRSWKKRHAFDKKRLIPSIGVYVGLNTNFLGEDYKEDQISPKAAVLLQNDFSDRLVLITNIIADKIATDNSVYSYILTMTYAMSSRWSIFVENQGDFREYKNDFYFGGGAAYLVSPDLQLDASVRGNTGTVDIGFIAGLGASYRFDWHEDELLNVDQDGNTVKRKKNGGLFSGIFKKKKK